MQEQIERHENLIKDPAKYLKEYRKEINGVPWEKLAPRYRQNLVNEHWPKEIANFKEQINVMGGILKARKK